MHTIKYLTHTALVYSTREQHITQLREREEYYKTEYLVLELALVVKWLT